MKCWGGWYWNCFINAGRDYFGNTDSVYQNLTGMYYILINSSENFEQTLYSSATDGSSKFLWNVRTYYQNMQTIFLEFP